MASEPDIAPEFQARLDGDSELRAAFEALTPGRQREYHYHFSGAKKSETRAGRVEKFVPQIIAGLGMREGSSGRSSRTKNEAGAGRSGKPRLLSGGNPQIAKGDGDAPVQAYLDAVPGWKQRVATEFDALIVETVPEVKKAVRWNSPFYGVEGRGWFVSYHCFDNYLKVTFLKGSALDPLPPVGSKDPDARYVHLVDEPLDREQLADWITQAAAIEGWDGF